MRRPRHTPYKAPEPSPSSTLHTRVDQPAVDQTSEMARLLHHLSLPLVAISLLLLLLPVLAAAAEEEPAIRISVKYPTEEQSRWLDRWSEKYQAQGSASGFSVHPATAEESAYLNSMFSDGNKGAASGDHSHGGGGGAHAGFDGHIEFDDHDHPFGRIVVDTVHSRASSSEPNDDLQNHESHSHAEYDDAKDL